MPKETIKIGDIVDFETSGGTLTGEYIRMNSDRTCVIRLPKVRRGRKQFYVRRKAELTKHVWLERC